MPKRRTAKKMVNQEEKAAAKEVKTAVRTFAKSIVGSSGVKALTDRLIPIAEDPNHPCRARLLKFVSYVETDPGVCAVFAAAISNYIGSGIAPDYFEAVLWSDLEPYNSKTSSPLALELFNSSKPEEFTYYSGLHVTSGRTAAKLKITDKGPRFLPVNFAAFRTNEPQLDPMSVYRNEVRKSIDKLRTVAAKRSSGRPSGNQIELMPLKVIAASIIPFEKHQNVYASDSVMSSSLAVDEPMPTAYGTLTEEVCLFSAVPHKVQVTDIRKLPPVYRQFLGARHDVGYLQAGASPTPKNIIEEVSRVRAVREDKAKLIEHIRKNARETANIIFEIEKAGGSIYIKDITKKNNQTNEE